MFSMFVVDGIVHYALVHNRAYHLTMMVVWYHRSNEHGHYPNGPNDYFCQSSHNVVY